MLVDLTGYNCQVEQTANLVLNLFPDLELAVEEAEPQLATNFFNMVSNV
jgi:hypothetical protein